MFTLRSYLSKSQKTINHHTGGPDGKLQIPCAPLRTPLNIAAVMPCAANVVAHTSYTTIHSPGVSIHQNACNGECSLVNAAMWSCWFMISTSKASFFIKVSQRKETLLIGQHGHSVMLTNEHLALWALWWIPIPELCDTHFRAMLPALDTQPKVSSMGHYYRYMQQDLEGWPGYFKLVHLFIFLKRWTYPLNMYFISWFIPLPGVQL